MSGTETLLEKTYLGGSRQTANLSALWSGASAATTTLRGNESLTQVCLHNDSTSVYGLMILFHSQSSRRAAWSADQNVFLLFSTF